MSDCPPVAARADFLSGLDSVVAQSRQDEQHAALLLIDLSNLRGINHRHGYGIGDQLLAEAHAQLLTLSKLPDNVYRVSGKTFAFLMPGLTNPAFVALALNRLQHSLEEVLYIDEDLLPVELRFGLAVNHHSAEPALSMLARAEATLAESRLGKPLQVDQAIIHESTPVTDIVLEQRFAEALYNNDFELHFQPKIALGSGEVYGAEALIRWHLAGHGYVSPEELVGLAFAAGKSYELTRWVVNRSLRYQREWRGVMELPLAINVPADLVSSPDLANMFQGALAIWGADPAMVTVEITEGAVIDDKEGGFHNLERLREMGLGLSIDDFGTGYSSLSYFKDIPATELKIDRSFVSRMLEDRQDRELVRIIIEIGHLFGLRVVAEGVEDEETLRALAELGCDVVQGFLLGRPMPEEQLRAWLEARLR
ncbi:putative bifunctional diguanylate cyclase/phosphodiesterase [Haliea atlantica]